MNVKYILKSNAPTSYTKNYYFKIFPGELIVDHPKPIDDPQFKLIFSNSYLSIYQNLRAFPRSFIAYRVEFARTEMESLELLRREDIDLKTTVIIEEMDRETREEILGKMKGVSFSRASSVKIIDYKPERIMLHAKMQAPGFLVLSDTFYPGWKAFVYPAGGGEGERKIYPADHLLRAIFLEKGEYRVEFFYSPLSFRIGWIISISTILLSVGILSALRLQHG